MKKTQQKHDSIWKALADATRREILDVLSERPQTTGELTARFDHLSRTNVMKHLGVLVGAGLVVVRREGRTRWNYLNPVPIQRVCDRWVSKHVSRLASSMSQLKDHVEERVISSAKAKPGKRTHSKPSQQNEKTKHLKAKTKKAKK